MTMFTVIVRLLNTFILHNQK